MHIVYNDIHLLATFGAQETNLHTEIKQKCLGSGVSPYKMLYACPAWSGFFSAADINQLDIFLNGSKRFGYCCQTTPSISELRGSVQ